MTGYGGTLHATDKSHRLALLHIARVRQQAVRVCESLVADPTAGSIKRRIAGDILARLRHGSAYRPSSRERRWLAYYMGLPCACGQVATREVALVGYCDDCLARARRHHQLARARLRRGYDIENANNKAYERTRQRAEAHHMFVQRAKKQHS